MNNLDLKSEYLDSERVAPDLAKFLFEINLEKRQLQEECDKFEPDLDLIAFLLDTDDHKETDAGFEEAARIGTTCAYVAKLPRDAQMAGSLRI